MTEIQSYATANRACSLIYSYIKTYNQGKWLIPVNVCPDVPLTFCLAGVDFEFIDINQHTLLIDEEECLSKLKQNADSYAGIVLVRTYGYLSNTSQFIEECKMLNLSLKIIDDRCLCMPERNPKMYSSDMVLYSTGHCKQIDLGGGGLAYYNKKESYYPDPHLEYSGTDEEALYKAAFTENRILNPIPKGWLKVDDYIDYATYMSRIEQEIEKRNNRRNEINAIYRETLPTEIQFPDEYNMWRFNIQVPSNLKDTILNKLFNNNLFASNHYHSANLLFDRKTYPNSDKLFASIINLFNDNHYMIDQAIKTANIINSCI